MKSPRLKLIFNLKRLKLRRLGLGLILGVLTMGQVHCGNNSSNIAPVTAYGTCAAGSVYSASYGCLLQSTCPSGYGMYNNQCVSATATTTTTTTTTTGALNCTAGYYATPMGCLPQSVDCPKGYALYMGQCYYGGYY